MPVCVYALNLVYGQDFALCIYINCYYVCVWVLQKMVQVLAITNTARRFPLGGQKASRQDRPFYLHSCCKLSSTRTRPHMLVYHLTLNHMYISMYAKLSLCVHAHMHMRAHTHMYAYKYLCMHWLLWTFLPSPSPFKVSIFICLTFETKGILRDLLCSDDLLFIAHAFPEFEEQAKKECLRQGLTECPKHYHNFPGTNPVSKTNPCVC